MEHTLRSRRYAVAAVPVAASLLGLAVLTAPAAAQAAATSTPGGAGRSLAMAPPSTRSGGPSSVAGSCSSPAGPLAVRCYSFIAKSAEKSAAAKAAAAKVATARGNHKSMSTTVSGSEPLTPADLQAAYGLTSASASDGYGQTVAIVDAFDDPHVQSDLSAYRAEFSLPACGSNSSSPQAGCLNVFNQAGTNLGTTPSAAPPQSPSGDDWTGETSLDVDMVSAICPNCTIDLIEANDDSMGNLAASENTAAVKLGAKFVSNSWGVPYFGGDYPGESANDSYFNYPGVAIDFASGDNGYGANYPGSSQYVTSVGGTFLDQNSSGNWTSAAWNDSGAGNGTVNANWDGVIGATGSGCAAGEPQPSWGPDASDSTASDSTGKTLCANRTEADVSAVADAPYGVDSYDAALCDVTPSTANVFGAGNCDTYGTSAAAPIITAMYALAGTPTPGTYPASYLYKDPSGLTHVTSGTNTSSVLSPLTCESNRQYLCNAADSLTTPYSGYNGPTGLGTPNGGLSSFKNNATGNVVSLPNPGTYDLQRGVSVSLPALKAIDSASGQTITYSASGLPAGLSINPSSGVIGGSVTYVENDTVKVTAKDSTGVSATAAFRIEASNSMTADYHWAGTGHVQVDVSNKCLDDSGNSSTNGAKVQIWTCASGDPGQNWLFQPNTSPGQYANYGLGQPGTVRIHSKCLDVKSNGTANGSLVDLWSCSGGANQQWKIEGAYGELYNPHSGKCLDDPGSSSTNGKQLDIWTCNGANNQNWLLPASPYESAVSNLCINDAGNSSANGAKIVSYACNGGSNEKVATYTAGPYAVFGINGKCLNARGNGTVNGTQVVLYNCSDSSGNVPVNSLWSFTAYGQIENAQAQKCLAIPNNATANGTALALEDCYGEPGEVWAAS